MSEIRDVLLRLEKHRHYSQPHIANDVIHSGGDAPFTWGDVLTLHDEVIRLKSLCGERCRLDKNHGCWCGMHISRVMGDTDERS